jgi:hypothetical protein
MKRQGAMPRRRDERVLSKPIRLNTLEAALIPRLAPILNSSAAGS